jgi:hypothetical protein
MAHGVFTPKIFSTISHRIANKLMFVIDFKGSVPPATGTGPNVPRSWLAHGRGLRFIALFCKIPSSSHM